MWQPSVSTVLSARYCVYVYPLSPAGNFFFFEGPPPPVLLSLLIAFELAVSLIVSESAVTAVGYPLLSFRECVVGVLWGKTRFTPATF